VIDVLCQHGFGARRNVTESQSYPSLLPNSKTSASKLYDAMQMKSNGAETISGSLFVAKIVNQIYA
jgi:hypothetical protein